jgi:hypothetical protein
MLDYESFSELPTTAQAAHVAHVRAGDWLAALDAWASRPQP